MTGATGDLFQEEPLGSQAMTKRIADFANGSKDPQLMTLFPNIGGKSPTGVEEKLCRVDKLTFAESFEWNVLIISLFSNMLLRKE